MQLYNKARRRMITANEITAEVADDVLVEVVSSESARVSSGSQWAQVG